MKFNLNFRKISKKWKLIKGKKIARKFRFNDFKEAVKFVNKVAEIAESENHHPDIFIFYNEVVVELWTHSAKGLTEKDFIVAAKIQKIASL
ncbi:MAG: 4a-hydroxytetrahydrobiopterin dehydratase [Candidatus Aenigmarchaeota archaeon]|nr:4a-hydroxytetrahydrobiopterin dehydratase [Candidatus Aenigmarchaeota archaeon]